MTYTIHYTLKAVGISIMYRSTQSSCKAFRVFSKAGRTNSGGWNVFQSCMSIKIRRHDINQQITPTFLKIVRRITLSQTYVCSDELSHSRRCPLSSQSHLQFCPELPAQLHAHCSTPEPHQCVYIQFQ